MTNLRHQIKSQWYYIFWGIATVAVVSGQVYVGLGYRQMAQSTTNLQQFFVQLLKDAPLNDERY